MIVESDLRQVCMNLRYISNELDWNSCGFPTTSMFISQSSPSSGVNSTAKQDSNSSHYIQWKDEETGDISVE